MAAVSWQGHSVPSLSLTRLRPLQGKAIDASYDGAAADHRDVHLSDSDVDDDLDRADTALHFGGGRFDRLNAAERGAYGGGGAGDMGDAYRSRKEELEDRIRMKKMQKAEKLKRKEDQGTLRGVGRDAGCDALATRNMEMT